MGAEQKVLLMRKPDKAQEIAQQEMAFYLSLSNYRNIWKRLGFTGCSNRFLDAMVAWATETAVVPEAEIPIRRRVIRGVDALRAPLTPALAACVRLGFRLRNGLGGVFGHEQGTPA